MVARPSKKEGLTGEKAARLLWEGSWGELGVFAQAHRPQANGRAESAGRVLRDIMRKLYSEEARCLLLLPLASRIRHDIVDPELGYSQYHLVFGRNRAGFGLPWPLVKESAEAKDWMDRLQSDRKVVHERLTRLIDAQSRRKSSSRFERLFKAGSLHVYLYLLSLAKRFRSPAKFCTYPLEA